MMIVLCVLQGAQFTNRGDEIEILTDLSVWMGIRNAIESINDNTIVGKNYKEEWL